jgi:hypothetical protein
MQLIEDSARFLARKDYGNFRRAFDALNVVDEIEFVFEHLLVKKE